MKLAVCDTEFGTVIGKDGKDAPAQVLEYGVALYDTETRAIIVRCAMLVPSAAHFSGEMHTPIHGITKEMLSAVELKTFNAASKVVESIFDDCDFAIAYNAKADKGFFVSKAQWLCAYEDFDWKLDFEYARQTSLVNLAVSYGVPVVGAHRALGDVELLCEIFGKVKDLDALVLDALEPRYKCIANVTYEERQKAKDLGFKWEPDLKRWWKMLNLRQLEEVRSKDNIIIDILEADD